MNTNSIGWVSDKEVDDSHSKHRSCSKGLVSETTQNQLNACLQVGKQGKIEVYPDILYHTLSFQNTQYSNIHNTK